jgi:hypothetical protein
MNYLWVFLASVAADVCWTLYFIEVGKARAARAATWSSLIVACGCFAVIQYSHEPMLMLAAIAGSWVGTYGTMKWGKK